MFGLWPSLTFPPHCWTWELMKTLHVLMVELLCWWLGGLGGHQPQLVSLNMPSQLWTMGYQAWCTHHDHLHTANASELLENNSRLQCTMLLAMTSNQLLVNSQCLLVPKCTKQRLSGCIVHIPAWCACLILQMCSVISLSYVWGKCQFLKSPVPIYVELTGVWIVDTCSISGSASISTGALVSCTVPFSSSIYFQFISHSFHITSRLATTQSSSNSCHQLLHISVSQFYTFHHSQHTCFMFLFLYKPMYWCPSSLVCGSTR